MIIYKATNRVNGKVYVGQTVRPLEVRIAEHKRHSNTPFDKAIQRHGIDNFVFEIIDRAETVEELNQKEKHWIEYYSSMGENGYNVCEGGDNTMGYRHREDSKQKMSLAKKTAYVGNGNPFYGKHHSEESRKKMSATRMGRVITDEWREHISESSVKKRKVRNIETGEIFNSIKEAAQKYNIVPTHITRVCRGKRNQTGGFHWEYVM